MDKNPHKKAAPDGAEKERKFFMKVNPVLQYVVEIKETQDIKEVAQLLSTGEWIATCATNKEPFLFSLGKVQPIEQDTSLLEDEPPPSQKTNLKNR